MGALEVVRPDVGGEAVLDAVRELERLFVGVERGDRHDRAEDLLLEDAGVGRDVGEHRRGDVVAGREAVGAAAAGDEAALGLADLDVAHDLVVVLGVHEGADLGLRVVRVAHDDALRLRRRTARRTRRRSGARPGCGEPAVQRSPLSENTPKIVASTAASRSASAKTTAGDLPPSSIDRPLRNGAALPKMIWPVRLSPVKEMSGTSGMLDQRVARLLTESVDEVEDALGQPGLLEDPGPQRRRQRRELGGLEHDRVAGGERRGRASTTRA